MGFDVMGAPRPTTVPLSAADLAGLVELGRPVMSPDGSHVATVHTGPETVELVTTRLDGEPVERRLVVHDIGSEPCWSPAGDVALVADVDANGAILTGPDAAGTVTVRLPDDLGRVRMLASGPVGMLVVANRGGRCRLWIVEVPGGAARLVDTAVDVLNVTATPDPAKVVAVTDDDRLVLLDVGSGLVERVLCEGASRPTSRDRTLEVSPDGSRVLFSLGGIEHGHRPAVVPLTGGPAHVLLPDEAGTVLAADWAADDAVVAQVFTNTRSSLVRVPLQGSSPGEAQPLGDMETGQPRFSYGRRRGRIVSVDGRCDAAPDLYVWNGSRRRRVSDANPWVRDRHTAPVSEVAWDSDGTTITGLLVEPERTGPGPMVVNLHGGPHYHWSAGWLGSWMDWAQLLAARGMAVFLPNPRGSTGRGWAYAHAVRGSLGDLPLRDVLSGVDAMVDRGVADPTALGVGGWSYGGYLTAWAIARSNRFAAAVVGAGISDYYSFIGSSPMGPVWEGFVPDARFPDRAGFDAISPVTHLSGTRTPTLIVHGDKDRKVPSHQALTLHRALRAAGVPAELTMFADEGHVLRTRNARVALLNDTVEWFASRLTGSRNVVAANTFGGVSVP